MRDLHYHSCVQRALYLHLRPRGSGPLYVYTSPVRVQAAGGEIDCSLSRRCPVTWGTVRLRHAEVIREQVLSQKSVRKVKERVVRKKKNEIDEEDKSEREMVAHSHTHTCAFSILFPAPVSARSFQLSGRREEQSPAKGSMQGPITVSVAAPGQQRILSLKSRATSEAETVLFVPSRPNGTLSISRTKAAASGTVSGKCWGDVRGPCLGGLYGILSRC
jgi:hypothetical protein